MNKISSACTACLNISLQYMDDESLHKFSQTFKFASSLAQPQLIERRLKMIFEVMKTEPSLFEAEEKNLSELKPIEKLKNAKVVIFTSFLKSISCDWSEKYEKGFNSKKDIDEKIVYIKSKINNEFNDFGLFLDCYNSPPLTILVAMNRHPRKCIKSSKFEYNIPLLNLTIKLVLEWGANPNGIPKGKKDGEALHLALKNQNVIHLKLLKKYGAQPDIKYNNKTALQVGCRSHIKSETLTIFLELFHPNPFVKDENSNTPKDDLRDTKSMSSIPYLMQYEREYVALIGNRIKNLFL